MSILATDHRRLQATRERRQARAEQVVLEARVVCGTGGGPDKTILNSPRFLWSAGYKTICAYMHPPGDPGFAALEQKAKEYRAPLLSVPDRGPWDWRVVSKLLTICRRERVTIWHGHDYKSNALGLLLKRFWPMRLVTTVHGWVKHTRRTPLYYKIDEACLPRYEAVICVSQDLKERCLACGVSEDRCKLVENGIDTDDYARKLTIEEAKRQLQIPEQRFTVGAVGRLSPEKGFDILIRAVHAMRQQGVDVQLLIAGEGDAAGELQALASQLGLSDRVRLAGHVSDPRSLFEALDVFALSSHREGLPNVVLEAMSLEVPVVATRINGVPQVIQDRENGILVEPGDVNGMAQAIDGLVKSPTERTRLASAGRRTVVERFSFQERMNKIRAIYDALGERN